MEYGEKNAVISGIGASEVGRKLGRTGLSLTVEACLAAIEDAGLKRDAIDGVSSWPGYMSDMPGFSPVSVPELKDALRLNLNWYCGAVESSGQFGSIINAIAAISAGLASHVLCFRTMNETTMLGTGSKPSIVSGGSERIGGWARWMVPFHAYSAANWTAMFAQRHFHEYGTTRQQLAQIALNARRNAVLNPRAIYRDPMTLDDYMAARMISTPLCLYDCDVPVDNSVAFIVSRRDVAKDLRRQPIGFEAVGCAHHGRFSWDQFDDLTTEAGRDAARMMWSRTDLKPKDVDVAELYDGFSFICLDWLEQLGFCGKGEGGSFIEGGQRIALDGEIPLNTNGGQLSAGRTHGFGLLHEACTQLRGDAGERQVANDPRIALAAAGGGPLGACLLLSRN